MVTATEVGRDLHLTVEGVEPFVVRPLPGRIGEQITSTYLKTAVDLEGAEEMTQALQIAIDGGVFDPATNLYVPLPEDQRTNYNRMQQELRTAEAESVLIPAFLWQTVLGIDGVTAFIEGGGGVAGGVKALGALAARLGLSPLRTSPRSALDDQIAMAVTPSTSSPQSGVKPGRRPLDRLRKKTR